MTELAAVGGGGIQEGGPIGVPPTMQPAVAVEGVVGALDEFAGAEVAGWRYRRPGRPAKSSVTAKGP